MQSQQTKIRYPEYLKHTYQERPGKGALAQHLQQGLRGQGHFEALNK